VAVTGVRRDEEPPDERQVEQAVREQTEARSEREQQPAADGRSEEQPDLPRRRLEAHRTRQLFAADDVVEIELRRG